jgi:hypothetical protein
LTRIRLPLKKLPELPAERNTHPVQESSYEERRDAPRGNRRRPYGGTRRRGGDDTRGSMQKPRVHY